MRNSPPEVPDKLDDESESYIALGLSGGRFASYSVGRLLGLHRLAWKEARYWMLLSAFSREDARCIRMFLTDWAWHDRQPRKNVHKFIPGEHYHVDGEKFDTLDAAIERVRSLGYVYGGLEERHVYAREGD